MNGVVVKEPAKLMYSAHVEEARSHTLFGVIVHCQGCLLAVECATTRLCTRTGLSAEPNRVRIRRGVRKRSGAYAIGLISWAASEGLTVSSLICDRWLTRKLATFTGSTDSLEC